MTIIVMIEVINVICGKCQANKEAVLITQQYQLQQSLVTIHYIPATRCNCQTYISTTVQQEIQAYLTENANLTQPKVLSYSEV